MKKNTPYDFDTYTIDLTKVDEIKTQFDFVLSDAFFLAFDQSEIKGGDVSVALSVKKASSTYEFFFDIKGFVNVSCDRCLTDIHYPIKAEKDLFVKIGDTTEEVDDDLIIVSEEEKRLNVAWLMYEFIFLSLAIKKVHNEGECDPSMISLLAEHNAELKDDKGKESDPRWNELKKILDNN